MFDDVPFTGTEIEFQSEIDVLGVCIDDDMNFNSHVNNVKRPESKLALYSALLAC